VITARFTVAGFALLAVMVAMQIDRIEQAWQWVAALGAALGVPTLLRWVWWRMTAAAELAGAVAGLATAAVTVGLGVVYERQLLWIAGISALATLMMLLVGPAASRERARDFASQTDPPGFWPGRSVSLGGRDLAAAVGKTVLVAAGVVIGLAVGHRLLVGG
jgi:Na+/proline symporter